MSLLVRRLHNWGAYARHDASSVRSCIASFWSKWTPWTAWDSAGWGDPNPHDPGDTPAIDDEDAERIDAYVRQLASGHRSALVRRYVHGHRPTTPNERNALTAAQMALAEQMGETIRTTRYIRLLIRG
jgi:hypothetical protein